MLADAGLFVVSVSQEPDFGPTLTNVTEETPNPPYIGATMSLFKLLGVLLAAYIALSLHRGEVYAKSGIWGRTYRRDDDAKNFWITIIVYILLSLALAFVF
jgi:hypothetical protein